MIKKLPICIQTSEKIIEGNYCYVDKTPFKKKNTSLTGIPIPPGIPQP